MLQKRSKPGRPTPTTVGEVEAAVRAECAPYADDRPGLVANAITLARKLDDPELVGLSLQASRQLMTVLLALHGNTKRKSGGRRLAVVRELSIAK
jgi:hypothetical protein